MKEINITNKNFKEEVLQSDVPVLVDFWAPWCGPCRMLGPVIEEIANEHDEFKVCKVNVDDNQDLAAMFQISSIPSVLIFKDGKPVKKSVGFKPKEAILDLLND